MSPAKPPRQPAGPISAILNGLQAAPKRVRRGSRDVIENAVSQLFDAAVQPHGVAEAGEYRLDELARLAAPRRATSGCIATVACCTRRCGSAGSRCTTTLT